MYDNSMEKDMTSSYMDGLLEAATEISKGYSPFDQGKQRETRFWKLTDRLQGLTAIQE